jgi:Na+:H+ antiporter, NhaA family
MPTSSSLSIWRRFCTLLSAHQSERICHSAQHAPALILKSSDQPAHNVELSTALIQFFFKNSLLLVAGAVAGLLWANLAPGSYGQLLHFALLENPFIGELDHGTRVISAHYAVNDILMALFFAIAGKEVWEATLPGGALQDPRKAASPMCATLGGMVGPALVYLLGAAAIGQLAELGQGWAIPCATDIAFSYLIARFVFGDAHPAIPFLLLLAIADEALALIILAVF